VDRYQYTYDGNSNRLTRTNPLQTCLSETYTYDGLDRLSCTERGGSALQSWGLDSVGNWGTFTDQGDDQARTHDAANETGTISGDLDWIDPAYDDAGNMTLAPRPGQETDADEALLMAYDGWNHLVKVYKDDGTTAREIDSGDTLIAEYQYDGQGRRVAKIVQVDGETVTYDRTDYEYNDSWQCLEERTETFQDLTGEGGARETPAETVAVQYSWDIRYIDAPVLRWRYGETTETMYYCQDANFNTTALVSAAGSVVERYIYDPYGEVDCLDQNWASGQSTSRVSNAVLYTGHPLDEETGLVYARWRYFLPPLGVWAERDPGGYVDGLNLQEYVASSPAVQRDPLGLGLIDWIRDLLGMNPPKVYFSASDWIDPTLKGTVLGDVGIWPEPTPPCKTEDHAKTPNRGDLTANYTLEQQQPDGWYRQIKYKTKWKVICACSKDGSSKKVGWKPDPEAKPAAYVTTIFSRGDAYQRIPVSNAPQSSSEKFNEDWEKQHGGDRQKMRDLRDQSYLHAITVSPVVAPVIPPVAGQALQNDPLEDPRLAPGR
jgi:RHS repeat-associated protein